jgi:hypothetical protein
MVITENVQRHVTIAVVVTIEEAAFLIAMQWVICCVKIQDNPVWRLGICPKESIHEEAVDHLRIADDLVVPMLVRDASRRQFKAIQSALAREGVAFVTLSCTLLAGRIDLADQSRKQCICAKVIVIVEILVSESDTEYPLRQKLKLRVFDHRLIAIVDETISEPLQEFRSGRDLTKQQPARIRRDPTTGEIGDHFSKSMTLKLELLGDTLCWHGFGLLFRVNCFVTSILTRSWSLFLVYR